MNAETNVKSKETSDSSDDRFPHIESFEENLAEFYANRLSLKFYGKNYDVFERRLLGHVPNFTYVPRWVYFFYAKFTANGLLAVKHYLYSEKDAGGNYLPISVDVNNLSAVAVHLAELARNDDPTYLLPGSDFQNVVFTKKSHVVLFFDEEKWDIHDFYDATPGVIFDPATPNHSFYDAQKLSVKMSNGDDRGAISMVNHMKRDEIGNDLLHGDSETYKFDVVIDVHYTTPNTEPFIMRIDPSTTNEGPPDTP